MARDYKFDPAKDNIDEPGSGYVANDVSRYEVYVDNVTKQWRYRTVAGNGDILDDSKGFDSKQEVLEALDEDDTTSGKRIDIIG